MLSHRYGQLVKTDASSTVLVELEGPSGTTLLVDQLGYFQEGRATFSDLTATSTRGSSVPLTVSTPGIEGIASVNVKVNLDAECPPGYYFGTNAAQGNDACAACKERTYEHGGQCHTCKAGMACSEEGLSFEDVLLLAGYWRTDDASADVRKCRFDEASCPGNTINNGSYCGTEYFGPLCSECADNYFLSWTGDGKCHKCDANKSHLPTIGLVPGVSVIGLVLIAAVARKYAKKSADSSTDSSTIDALQKLGRLAKVKVFNLFLASQVHIHSENLSQYQYSTVYT